MKELIELAEQKGFYCFPQAIDIFASPQEYPWYHFNEEDAEYLWMCMLQKWLRDEHDINVLIFGGSEDHFYHYYYHIDANLNFTGNGFFDYKEALQEGLTKALTLIPHETLIRWRSVHEQLPEEGERVLVFPDYILCQYGIEDIAGDITGIKGKFSYYSEHWDEDREPDFKVTHWMPLPKPPLAT